MLSAARAVRCSSGIDSSRGSWSTLTALIALTPMATLGIVAAFARYKATLINHQWAVSAELPDAVVMSLWAHLFKRGMVYEDRLSRWSGNGNALFRKHLELIQRDGLPVYLVIATSSDPAAVNRGEDASSISKTFAVRPDLVGKLVHFDGDAFQIEFSKR